MKKKYTICCVILAALLGLSAVTAVAVSTAADRAEEPAPQAAEQQTQPDDTALAAEEQTQPDAPAPAAEEQTQLVTPAPAGQEAVDDLRYWREFKNLSEYVENEGDPSTPADADAAGKLPQATASHTLDELKQLKDMSYLEQAIERFGEPDERIPIPSGSGLYTDYLYKSSDGGYARVATRLAAHGNIGAVIITSVEFSDELPA